MSSILHTRYMTLFVGTVYMCIGDTVTQQTSQSSLPKSVTHMPIHIKQYLFYSCLPSPQKGKAKAGRVYTSCICKMVWCEASFYLFVAFFRLAVFTSTTRVTQIKGLRMVLHQHYVQIEEDTSDFAMIKIHTERVWALTCPIRHWCPFGRSVQKRAYVLGSSKRDLLHKHQSWMR